MAQQDNIFEPAIQNRTGEYGGISGTANVNELGVDKMGEDKIGVNQLDITFLITPLPFDCIGVETSKSKFLSGYRDE